MNPPPFETRPILSVGVTGHRTLAAPDKVKADLAAIFAAIGAVTGAGAAGEAPVRIITPLAEGADRLFAEAGLGAGASMHCPLPFARREFENDFDEASKLAFRRLLGRAERVFELDGDPARRAQAYLEGGKLLLGHCDVLIAVWDRQPSRGAGGTADIVGEALGEGLVVIWIDPAGVKPPCLLEGHAQKHRDIDLQELDGKLQLIVRLPDTGKKASAAVEYRTFVAERPPRLSFGSAFDLFVRAFQWRLSLKASPRRGWLEASNDDWASPYAQHPQLKATCAPCLDGDVDAAFARADTLAGQYAGFYRSTFLANFLLSATAVTIALLGAEQRWRGGSGTNAWLEALGSGAELAAIMTIVCLTMLANRRNWHERWIEYRHLAEQLRPLRFLFPLGLTLPKAHMARPVQGSEQPSAWVDWLTRRVERSLGLPNVAVDPAYLAAVKAFAAEAVLDEQIKYHKKNTEKMHKVDHRLHEAGLIFFWLSGGSCVIELLMLGVQHWTITGHAAGFVHLAHDLLSRKSDLIGEWLIALSGILPAWGAALLGIRNVGEFARLQRRSAAMEAALLHIKAEFDHEPEQPLQRSHLGAQLHAMAAQMMSETADWRTLVITRRIELI